MIPAIYRYVPYRQPRLPPPMFVDGVDMSSPESLLRSFRPYRIPCLWCQIDFKHQTYGLGGGRADLVCSDKCLKQMMTERARIAGFLDDAFPEEIIQHASERIRETEAGLPEWVEGR